MTTSQGPRPAAQPFTGMALDRADAARKDPAWVRELVARPDARVLAAGPGTVLGDSAQPSLARVAPARGRLPDPILLGLEQGAPLFAVDLDELSDPTAGGPAADAGAAAGGRGAGLTR